MATWGHLGDAFTTKASRESQVVEPRDCVRRLKAIRPAGRSRPLFFIHALTGGTGIYRNLAAALPEDVPIFGIDAVGRENWGEPDRSIESMARSAIQVLRRVEPAGPYQLCGYCLGGSVAYEMARQIELEQGAAVGFLGIIDTLLWLTPPLNEDLQKWLLFWSAVTGQTALARAAPTNWFWKLDEAARLDAIWHDAIENGRRIQPQPIDSLHDLRRFFRYFQAMWSAGRGFVPRPHGTPFLYLETAESRRQRFGELWRRLTEGRAEVVPTVGTHMTVLVPPFLAAVAQALAARLDRSGQ